jgi:hypothetical protein
MNASKSMRGPGVTPSSSWQRADHSISSAAGA